MCWSVRAERVSVNDSIVRMICFLKNIYFTFANKELRRFALLVIRKIVPVFIYGLLVAPLFVCYSQRGTMIQRSHYYSYSPRIRCSNQTWLEVCLRNRIRITEREGSGRRRELLVFCAYFSKYISPERESKCLYVLRHFKSKMTIKRRFSQIRRRHPCSRRVTSTY